MTVTTGSYAKIEFPPTIGHDRCRRLITLTLGLDELLLHQGQPLDFPCDLPAETFRQGVAVARD